MHQFNSRAVIDHLLCFRQWGLKNDQERCAVLHAFPVCQGIRSLLFRKPDGTFLVPGMALHVRCHFSTTLGGSWWYFYFTDNETRHREMKQLAKGCPARIRAEIQSHFGAASLEKITRFLFFIFLSHFIHLLSNWRVGGELMAVQSIGFSTSESTSNL